MSTDLSEADLKDIVAQTLENNGILAKIRAQLRANVFLALEEQQTTRDKLPAFNKELKQFLSNKEGSLVFSLVRDFLEYFNLEYTLTVLDAESNTKKSINRRELFDEFGLKVSGSYPVLTEVLQSNRNVDNQNFVNESEITNSDIKSKTFTSEIVHKSDEDEGDEEEEEKMSKVITDDKESAEKSDNSLSNVSDGFFDEPIPKNDQSNLMNFSNNEADKVNNSTSANGHGNKIENEHFGNGLPELPGAKKEEIPPDDDYDEDFSSSTSKSEKNLISEQSIEEEIEEVADILNSQSEGENLTSDRTISQLENVTGIDYSENIE